jgi:hypothetical protein
MYRLALMVVGLAVCLLPSFIAIYRNKRHKTAIVAVNLVFGALIASWVGLRVWGLLGAGLAGWSLAMIWSLWPGESGEESR